MADILNEDLHTYIKNLISEQFGAPANCSYAFSDVATRTDNTQQPARADGAEPFNKPEKN